MIMHGHRLLALSLASATVRHASTRPAFTAPEPTRYSMVAMDMDGTLLNENHEISDRSLKLIQSLSAQGVLVALATGRSGPAVYKHVKQLDLPHALPVVCYNGGSCKVFPPHPTEPQAMQRTLFNAPLSLTAVNDVLSIGRELGVMAQYYVGDDIFVVCKTPADEQLVQRYRDLTGAHHTYVDSYEEIVEKHGLPYKILLMTNDVDDVCSAAARITARKSHAPTYHAIRGSPPFFVEFLDVKTCKGRGLEKLCESLRVDLGSVVAFGDGDNDIEFLQAAGLGIAMSNARPIVQASADQVSAKTHKDDGVAHELEALVQLKELVPAEAVQEGRLEGLWAAAAAAASEIKAVEARGTSRREGIVK